MNVLNNAIFAALCLAAAQSSSSAELPTGLDGATGNVFKVDVAAKTFELLKETEYDPKTDIGKSRFTIHWEDGFEITRIEEVKNFDGIKGPVLAKFLGIDQANRTAMGEGKPFEARVAEIHSGAGAESVSGISEDGNGITAWFTPAEGKDIRSGSIKVDGKDVAVSLRKSNWRIFHHQPVSPEELSEGFWKATLHGAEKDGRFVVGRMEVSALEDPRKSDDPKLPRVLVIGDSISMNYHESAKEALKGVANYHRNEGNSFSSVHGVNNAELWLGNYQEKGGQWDVIQFNHGLHDLKQAYDKASDTFGEYAVSKELYKASLDKEIAVLKKTGAKLIWCTTTPVPTDIKGEYARRKGAAKEFNEAALEVMKRHPEILINDLHGVVEDSPVFDGWRKTTDVHFYKPDEQQALGEAVAAAVRKALETDPPKK